ncbi:MAG TPA: nitroreductase family protein [Holophaga sp.]|nr:nitroreductase family protein [Holophaga sp.]HPS68822.1 nitroreductase family protein [Holophaga sp.]
MDAMDCLFTRRSIRSFKPEPLSPDAVREPIRAAMYAPSAGNQRPWHFLVVSRREDLAFIARIHPYAGMCLQAAGAVLVCGEPGLAKYPDMWVQDCAAATQNLLLALHAEGLGGVYVGVHPREERMKPLAAHFGLPASIVPFSLVPYGRPATVPEQPDRFMAERIRTDRW